MEAQNKVVLSIGSNQGKRLENIEQCIRLLHNEVGTIIKISKLYETPAWGFESEAFYNCALLLHTYKVAEDVLIKILDIEKRLGRVRKEQSGYQARMIDIDIIAFNGEVINTNNLQVPHPQMQNRRFVLLPMCDLNLDFVHPILNKSSQELLESCIDQSDYKVIEEFILPLKSFT